MFASSMFFPSTYQTFDVKGQSGDIRFYSLEEKISLFKQTPLWAYSVPIFGEDAKIDENFFNYFPKLLLIEKGTQESLLIFEEIRAEIFKGKEISKFMFDTVECQI